MRIEILTFEGLLSVVDPSIDKVSVSLISNCLKTYGERLITISQSDQTDYSQLGSLHYEIGKLHDRLSRHSYAETHYKAAARAFAESGVVSPQVAQTHLLLGEVRVHNDVSNPFRLVRAEQVEDSEPIGQPEPIGQSDFHKALKLAETLRDPWLQARAHCNLAQLQAYNLKDENALENALTKYKEAETLINQANNPDNCPINALLLAEIARSIDLVQTALVVAHASEWAESLLGNRGFEQITREGVGSSTVLHGSGNSKPWWPWW